MCGVQGEGRGLCGSDPGAGDVRSAAAVGRRFRLLTWGLERQVLRPLDSEQEKLNRERAALVARLLMPSKPAAALALIRLDSLRGTTLLQWRRWERAALCSACARIRSWRSSPFDLLR